MNVLNALKYMTAKATSATLADAESRKAEQESEKNAWKTKRYKDGMRNTFKVNG